MTIYLVPDPTWKGKGPAPTLVRSDAMRRMFKAGSSVTEVAEYFDVPYRQAYRAINPPRKRAGQTTAAQALTPARLKNMSKGQLEKIATAHGKTPAALARIESATDELLRRDPHWLED